MISFFLVFLPGCILIVRGMQKPCLFYRLVFGTEGVCHECPRRGLLVGNASGHDVYSGSKCVFTFLLLVMERKVYVSVSRGWMSCCDENRPAL